METLEFLFLSFFVGANALLALILFWRAFGIAKIPHPRAGRGRYPDTDRGLRNYETMNDAASRARRRTR